MAGGYRRADTIRPCVHPRQQFFKCQFVSLFDGKLRLRNIRISVKSKISGDKKAPHGTTKVSKRFRCTQARRSGKPPSDEGGGFAAGEDGGRETRKGTHSPPVTSGDSPLVRGGLLCGGKCRPSAYKYTSLTVYRALCSGIGHFLCAFFENSVADKRNKLCYAKDRRIEMRCYP